MYQNIADKGLLASIIYVLSFLSNCVNEMFVVLTILMIFDWITGVILAKKENRYTSKKGIWGAVKKLLYMILIVCGYLADLTIITVAAQLGLGFTTYGALGFAVVFYLVGNEGVSVYTNAQKLGLPVPTFLSNIYHNFKVMAKTSVTKTNNDFKKELKEGEEDGFEHESSEDS